MSERADDTEDRPLADAYSLPEGRDPACAVGQPCPYSSACNNPPGSCAVAEACRYTVVIPGAGHGGLTKVPVETLGQVRQVLTEQDPQGRAWACDSRDEKRRLKKADLR